MSATRSVEKKDLKLLWGRAGGRCSEPECRRELTLEETPQDPDAIIGEMAHMIAHGVDGPRPDSTLTDAERKSYGNLILLCPICHKRIDKQPKSYTLIQVRRLEPVVVAPGFWVLAGDLSFAAATPSRGATGYPVK